MKKSIITLLLTTSLISAETTYLNQIKQINSFKNDAGVIIKTRQLISNLGETGERKAAEGIMGTSTFKLITINGDTGDYTVLDTENVSSYNVDAEVVIQGPSADSYNSNPNNEPNHVQRTQVGQGFTINCKVTGLLPKADGMSEAGSSVLYQEKTYTYSEGGTFIKKGVAPTQTTQQDIDANGSISEVGSALGMSGADITKARGEKVISIFMKPDEFEDKYKEIDSAKIQIWPVSTGKFTGIKSGQVYSRIPTLNIDLIDVYPGSYTRIKVTGVSFNLKKPVIVGKYTHPLDEDPVNNLYHVCKLDKKLKKEGTYKAQLLHTTPFEADKVWQEVTFEVDRTITVKGSVITSE